MSFVIVFHNSQMIVWRDNLNGVVWLFFFFLGGGGEEGVWFGWLGFDLLLVGWLVWCMAGEKTVKSPTLK